MHGTLPILGDRIPLPGQAQYVEIYNEQVCDLLSSDPSGSKGPSKLDIREKPDGEVYVEGACEVVVKTREEIAGILEQGNAKRQTASHKSVGCEVCR